MNKKRLLAASMVALVGLTIFGTPAHAENTTSALGYNNLSLQGSVSDTVIQNTLSLRGSETTVAIHNGTLDRHENQRFSRDDNNLVIANGASDVAIHNNLSLQATNGSLAIHDGTINVDAEKGQITGGAAGIDPNNIGDTLTGTNHVTYSSTSPGSYTGSVNIQNYDGTSQTLYYNYTKPGNYSVTSTRINDNVTYYNVNNKEFTNAGTAIYNTQDISDIDVRADFLSNTIGIQNSPIDTNITNFGTIIADFIGNHNGIYNGGAIDSIVGDFIVNIKSNDFDTYGPAINNMGIINSITGNFIGNSSTANGNESFIIGGAIYNQGDIGAIKGNFIGNSIILETTTNSSYTGTWGGAIGNNSDMMMSTSIEGDFIANKAVEITQNTKATAYGGAVHNSGAVSFIKGNFTGNIVTAESDSFAAMAYGGALNNDGGSIQSITGNYKYNKATSTGEAFGGAISNSGGGYITSISGDYTQNKALADSSYGGAIYNTGTISSIESNFEENMSHSYGGAIYNGGVTSGNPVYRAGARITLADTTFKGNYVDDNGTITPNSIYNAGTINIKANSTVTVNDGWQSFDNGTNAGKLVMGSDSKLNMNIANGTIQNDNLGAITNVGTINATVDIDTSDVSNPLADTIAVSSVTQEGKINLTSLNFIGGSIEDFKDHLLTVQILKNTNNSDDLQLALAGAIADSGEVVLHKGETSTQTDNFTGTALWTDTFGTYDLSTDIMGTIDLATTNTTNDSIGVTVTREVQNKTNIQSQGDTFKVVNQSDLSERNLNASTAEEEYKVTENIGETESGNLTITGKADGDTRSTIDFDGHKGFELNNDDTTLTLKDVEIKGSSNLISGTADNNVNVVLDNVNLHDNGTGITTAGNIDIKGRSTISDDIMVTNNVSTVTVDGTDEVNLDNRFMGAGSSNLTFQNGNINLGENARIINFGEVSLNNTNITVKDELSFANSNLRVDATSALSISNDKVGVFSLNNLTLNDTLKMSVDADLANKTMDKLSANNVTVNGGKLEVEKINLLSPTTEKELSLLFTNNTDLANVVSYTGENEIVYSPIFKYTTTYEKKDDGGYFKFVLPSKGGGGGGDTPAASDFNPAILASSVTTQVAGMSAMNTAMNTAFYHADSFFKQPMLKRLSLINSNKYALASTEYNGNLGEWNDSLKNNGVWVKPYVMFENIPLKNGPKVKSITYGTLIGADSDFHEHKNGWNSVSSAYIGYNGSSLDYTGVSANTNGGLLGFSQSFYKGNFFTALTASAGAMFAEEDTMFGKDHNTTLMAGVASKSGYNLEFAEGRFIIQPQWNMSYIMLKTFDYTNSAGVRINSDPIHTIQLNPTIRFIGNTKNGWQPYASVGMVWNIMNETKATANGVKLPEMSTKPYVEYGIGVQKQIGDKFSGYAQAMVRNGGRNGVALTAGFRWALGANKKNKVDKSVMKNNNHEQNKVYNNKAKSDKTSQKAVIKPKNNSSKSRNIAQYMSMVEE